MTLSWRESSEDVLHSASSATHSQAKNMAKNRRCREKFHAALYRLAVGEGDVRVRLQGAYRYLIPGSGAAVLQ